MPITSVQVFPRIAIEDFIKTLDGDEKPIINYAIISIIGVDDKPVLNSEVIKLLNTKGCVAALPLQFDDITKTEYEKNSDVFDMKGCILFNQHHAQQVIQFVKRINDMDIPVRLWLNCQAGISRSGACGLWANDFLQLNYDTFMLHSPGVHPNIHILSLLKRESGMGY